MGDLILRKASNFDGQLVILLALTVIAPDARAEDWSAFANLIAKYFFIWIGLPALLLATLAAWSKTRRPWKFLGVLMLYALMVSAFSSWRAGYSLLEFFNISLGITFYGAITYGLLYKLVKFIRKTFLVVIEGERNNPYKVHSSENKTASATDIKSERSS